TETSQKIIEVAERYSDGLATEEQFTAAEADARTAFDDALENIEISTEAALAVTLVFDLFTNRYGPSTAIECARAAAAYSAFAIGCAAVYETITDRDEEQSQASLLRDIFGHSFCPLPPRPEAIAPLAEQIYAGQWELMPLLGEWLQEHGYWSEGEHCL